MPGGLMQLVAYGAQDLYLTSNPQVTFFKVVYRRHTNFATESVEQPFSGTPDFGRKATCEIQRSGDLISKMYIRAELPALDAGTGKKIAWCSKVGHALISSVELNIGGVQIDKQYGDWLNVWYELARNFAHDRTYDHMIGNTVELTTLAQTQDAAVLWIPLKFACCRNDGLALPVIALQYHEIRINVEFETLAHLVNYTSNLTSLSGVATGGMNASLYVDFVYLDNDERKRFAQATHEYLFEQLQFTGDETVSTTNPKYRLNLNHPCKELLWVARHSKYQGSKFLAVNSNNWDAARVEATKRFVLRLADYNSGLLQDGASANHVKLLLQSSSTDKFGVAQKSLTEWFNAIDGVYISNASASDNDVDNITILGELLPVDVISVPTDVLFANATIDDTISGDGDADNDIVLYQHDNYGVYIDGSGNPTEYALLQLNGHERFSRREGMYFNYVQPYQCHTNGPVDGVNVYSFALTPEEHQPSGACNMSRIDNATLNLQIHADFKDSNSTISIYAVNYNVLRVMSGMGGKLYVRPPTGGCGYANILFKIGINQLHCNPLDSYIDVLLYPTLININVGYNKCLYSGTLMTINTYIDYISINSRVE